jgi:5-methylcytosine-specific restriction endonuclease McrA
MSNSLHHLSDDQVLTRFRDLARRGHALEAELLAHLGEVDRRRLYAREGYSSLFRYCVEALNFSEAEAYLRITVARGARSIPALLAAIGRGELHLSGARLLLPQLTPANAGELLGAAAGRSKAQIEQLLADRLPKPDRRTHIVLRRAAQVLPGKVPPSASPPTDAPPTPRVAPAVPREARPRSEPLGNERYRVSFTLDGDTYRKLEEVRAWMRHRIPDGDHGAILAQAISLLHALEHKRKSAEMPCPRPQRESARPPSRHVPAAIRRAVWKRDGGRCSYRSPNGRRCGTKEFLEIDHGEPWEWVREHAVENLRLRCRTHNQYTASLAFGEAHMARFRKDAARAPADREGVRVRRTRSGTS